MPATWSGRPAHRIWGKPPIGQGQGDELLARLFGKIPMDRRPLLIGHMAGGKGQCLQAKALELFAGHEKR